MSVVEVEATAANTDCGPRITHRARDPQERPLVALCGAIQGENRPSYRGRLEDEPFPCVVCLDLKRTLGLHGEQR